MKAAAENLQRFDAEYADELRTVNGQIFILIALTYLTLEELASGEANSRIQQTINQVMF